MAGFLSSLSVLILFLSFVLIANKRITSYIRTFRLQSAAIALLVGIMGIDSIMQGKGFDALILCGMILILKVGYIPYLLRKTFVKIEYIIEKDFFFNIPILVFLSIALVVFCHFTLLPIEGINRGDLGFRIVNSVSVMLIGMLFMISRKKALGQIVGFLTIENGLFVVAMFSTHGMPVVVDVGIFIDLVTAVLIMGLLVFRISEKFDSINTNKLKKLRG